MREVLNSTALNLPPSVIITIGAWSLIWKGIALWKSARQNQRNWFIVLLVVSTLGILEIIYLSFFQKTSKNLSVKKRS